jgi:hypothetical protein
MMDAAKLKFHAELLEQAIRENLGKNKDVDWLAAYPPLLQALEDAKGYRIDRPRELGVGRWELESSIQDFENLSERLAEFNLLLRGWILPSEGGP